VLIDGSCAKAKRAIKREKRKHGKSRAKEDHNVVFVELKPTVSTALHPLHALCTKAATNVHGRMKELMQ
jgi:hypothetical protein